MYLCISCEILVYALYNYVQVEQLMPYLDSAEKYSCTGSALATRPMASKVNFMP